MNKKDIKEIISDKLLELAIGIEGGTVVIENIEMSNDHNNLGKIVTIKLFGVRCQYDFRFTLTASDLMNECDEKNISRNHY